MKKVFTILLILFSSGILQAQSGFTVKWEQNFGGSLFEEFTSAVATADGGFLCVGRTESYGTGEYGKPDIWLVKTDSEGHYVWDKTYGVADSLDRAYKIMESGDGNYLIAGERVQDIVYGNGWNAIVLKIDPQGNEIWYKFYGGEETDMFRNMSPTNDGGFIACGVTRSFGAQFIDAWLVKIDADGNQEWQNHFGGEGYEVFKSVFETSDGGFIACGFSNSDFGNGSYDYYVVKTNVLGEQEWMQTYGDEHSNRAYCMAPASDDTYIIGGAWMEGSFDGARFDLNVLEINQEDGGIVWQQTYPDTTNNEPFAVCPSTDNGWIFAGKSGFAKAVYQTDARITKIDQNHDIVADTAFGYEASETLEDIIPIDYNNYLVMGSTMSIGAGSGDAWLLKIKDWEAPPVGIVKTNANDILISPNPSSGIINLSGFQTHASIENIGSLEIYDITGNVIYKMDKIPSRMDLSNYPKGIYFITIKYENNLFVEKLILQ
ncbi:MAG: hypothetical protein B7C24_12640 [Bacteroidetes bacterium 4572_77]|nr:MAG: hypothetical protein B7C24_12640 [Bacteroidetes bacterium 4572_77]